MERSLQAAAKARALLQQLEDSVQQHQQQLAALPPEQPRQHEAARAAIALLESQQQRVQADLASAEDRARRAHARYQTAQLAKMCALGADLESAKAQLAVIVPPEEPSGLPTPAVVRRRVGDKGRNQMNE